MGRYGRRPEDGRRSYGHSFVVGPWGEVIAEAPEEGTGVTFADLDLSELRRVRAVCRRFSIAGSESPADASRAPDAYELDDDPSRIDLDVVCGHLGTEYWSSHRTREEQERLVRASTA